ncbi:MAG: OsmC family protein, partial [Pseudomonadota bacterium]
TNQEYSMSANSHFKKPERVTRKNGDRLTSPEELLAAGIASSFSLVLWVNCSHFNIFPKPVRTKAIITMEDNSNSYPLSNVQGLHLEVSVGLKGVALEELSERIEVARRLSAVNLLNIEPTIDISVIPPTL